MKTKTDYSTVCCYDPAVKRQEWEQDLRKRQCNIVFPDTVLNEGRFYRHLLRGNMPISAVQRIGVFILALSGLLLSAESFAMAVNHLLSGGSKAIMSVAPAGAGVLSLLFGWLLMKRAILPGAQAARRQSTKDVQHPDKFQAALMRPFACGGRQTRWPAAAGPAKSPTRTESARLSRGA